MRLAEKFLLAFMFDEERAMQPENFHKQALPKAPPLLAGRQSACLHTGGHENRGHRQAFGRFRAGEPH